MTPLGHRIRLGLLEMAKSIARTKAEIAEIRSGRERRGKFGEAVGVLDPMIRATEDATSDILAAAEQVQEIASTLREQGLHAESCDVLDSSAKAIYLACSFRDLTGERTRKVIQALGHVEGRINAMIDVCGPEETAAGDADGQSDSTNAGAGGTRPPPPANGTSEVDMEFQPVQVGPVGMGNSVSEARRQIDPDLRRDAGTVRPKSESEREPRALPVDRPSGSVKPIDAEDETYGVGCPPMPELVESVELTELDQDPTPAVPAVALLPAPFPPVATEKPEAETTASEHEKFPVRGDTAAVAAPTPDAKPNSTIASAALALIDALSPEEKIALFS